ncbi:MAG: CDP-alcohol phosphatidyltransferase family protein [Nitrospinae bacterium]|nr:CDP-alcohol phosphatidyltransferase family protein [Nitrospinota bacterium]
MDQNTKIRTAVVLVDGICPFSQNEGIINPVFQKKIGGLTLFERIAHVSRKAGVERLLVSGWSEPEAVRLLQGKVFRDLEIKFLDSMPSATGDAFKDVEAEIQGESNFFFISGDCVFEPNTLKELNWKADLLCRFDAIAAISESGLSGDCPLGLEIQGDHVSRVFYPRETKNDCVPCPGLFLGNRNFLDAVLKAQATERAGWLDALQKACEAKKLGLHDVGDSLLLYAGAKKALRDAEKKVYQRLIKKTDGFLAAHINRRISLFITKFLVKTSLTPNNVTLINLAIGLIGAVFFAVGGYGPALAGALVFQLSSITDGCDGEIARLKFLESRFGGWLDIFCDNLTHIAVFAGIAYGAYRIEPAPYLFYCGWLAVLGTLMSFLLVAFQLYRKESTKGPLFTSVMENRAGMGKGMENILNAQDSLARRDFTYLLLLFALLGYSKYFLALTAIGSNIFWMLLVFSWIKRPPRGIIITCL